MPSTLESFELLVHAEQLAPRLEAAATALAQLLCGVHDDAETIVLEMRPGHSP